ncbi:MAG: hypothetical protein KJP08_03885 [Gammaproteobacteria bacterium]|nr:hypothetical protein [Gammaproteobacteria bacterium]NNF48314.1 hypothetical protein [Woeseiaceae bacterium]MBT8093928.1 hypothetical protein [Gammaproteobacteria bacterium]MBT8105504.1 hypothetical protein [Gammaproteobacteria bacterium]NNK25518.1 hypothetical protein [Woeseiaceae bacterium]
MADHVNRFHAALIVLAGHGHVKQRLIEAFEKHLADIDEDDLPVTVKQSFADLRCEMNRITPLHGESPICASVRKLSLDEAGDCAGRVATIFAEVARCQGEAAPAARLNGKDETQIPPFLVKTV